MKNQRNYIKELKAEAIKMIIQDGLSHAPITVLIFQVELIKTTLYRNIPGNIIR